MKLFYFLTENGKNFETKITLLGNTFKKSSNNEFPETKTPVEK